MNDDTPTNTHEAGFRYNIMTDGLEPQRCW